LVVYGIGTVARLAQLEREASMTGYDVTVKRLDPVRVVALSEDLADHNQISEAADRLYPRLHGALARQGVSAPGVSYAFYEDTGDDERPLRLTTALPVPAGVVIEEDGIATIDVPGVERAATTVVCGAPTRFHDAFAAIHNWVEQTGERATVFDREVYLDCGGPRDTWVTELQTILEPKP
jgi:hypothetical protein